MLVRGTQGGLVLVLRFVELFGVISVLGLVVSAFHLRTGRCGFQPSHLSLSVVFGTAEQCPSLPDANKLFRGGGLRKQDTCRGSQMMK